MKGKSYDRVLLFIACLVTIIWGVSIVIQTIFPKHPAPDSVNQIMIIVATGLFTGSVLANIRKNGGGNSDDK